MTRRFHLLLGLLIVLGIAAVGCNKNATPAGPDVSKLKVGMTGEEVRKLLGEPSPGERFHDTTTGATREQWVYADGDNALFLVLENDRLTSWDRRRATMKDAAAKVRVGMTADEVVAALGPADSSDANHMEYIGKVAAIDSLRVDMQNGRVTRVQVVPNAAVQP